MEYSYELYHHGIKGMRWGIRRYQNKDGSLTAAGLKRRAKLEGKLDKLSSKSKKTEDSEETIEAKKTRILESRSAKQLYDNANLFTYNELQAAKMRLELERNIKNLEPAQVSKGEQFANKFVKTSDTISNVIQSGTKTYNNVAKIFNSIYGNDRDMSLPLISEKTTSKLDKFKEETEWQKAKNERKKALEEAKGKEKTEVQKLNEENALLGAKNKRRELERKSKELDMQDYNDYQKTYEESLKSDRSSTNTGPRSNDGAYRSTTSSNSSTVNAGRSTANDVLSRLPASVSNLPTSTVNSGRSAVETMLDVYDRDGSYLTTTPGSYSVGDGD